MKIKLSLLLLFLCSTLMHGQQYVTVTIDGFSDEYCIKLLTKDTTALTNSFPFIYDKKKHNNKVIPWKLITGFDVDDNNCQNVKTIPYNKQNFVIYEDFNFDGFIDFAIADFAKKNDKGIPYTVRLNYGDSFGESTLMTDSFYVGSTVRFNSKNKTVEVWDKPDYDNATAEVYQVYFEDIVYKCSTWKYNASNNNIYTALQKDLIKDDNNNIIKTVNRTVRKFVLNKNSRIILSFNIAKNGKKVVLYTLADSSLHYAFINKEDEVELYYPNKDTNMDYPNGECLFKSSQSDPFQVTFHNKDADYTIWDEPGKLGVEIAVKGKTYFLEGDVQSKIGLITKLKDLKTPKVCFSWQ